VSNKPELRLSESSSALLSPDTGKRGVEKKPYRVVATEYIREA
jgi:hypothetical protein